MPISPLGYEVWKGLTEDDLKVMKTCRLYADNDGFKLPGHNLIMMVAKLERMILNPTHKYLREAIIELLATYYLDMREQGLIEPKNLDDITNFLRWLEVKNGTAS